MQNAVLKIDNMDDDGCADSVAQLLISIGGVRDVRVSLLDSVAKVEYDESHTSPLRMVDALAKAGYPSLAEAANEAPARAGGCCGGCCGG